MFTEIKVGVAYTLGDEVIPHFPGTPFKAVSKECYKMYAVEQLLCDVQYTAISWVGPL